MHHVTRYTAWYDLTHDTIHHVTTLHCLHLVCTLEPVHGPMHIVHTRRQIKRGHPLTVVVTSLCDNLRDFPQSTKVYFQPLIVVVVTRAPGPNVTTSLYLTQSRKSGGVVLIRFGWRGDTTVRDDALVWHSQRSVAQSGWEKETESNKLQENKQSSFACVSLLSKRFYWSDINRVTYTL